MISSIAFGLFGLAVLVSIALAFSQHKKSVDWKLVAAGIGLQIVFAVIVIIVPGGREFFDAISHVFVKIVEFALIGGQFIFGDLSNANQFGFIFAFQVLPTIIFFASLVVRPYIAKMTESELFTMMVGGMATIAGAVLAAYIAMLGGTDEAQRLFYARHLLAASVMAAPATIVIAKLLRPETEESLTKGTVHLEIEKTATNVIEAAANGAADGVKLSLNVAGMLLAFFALITMINYPLAWLGELTGLDAVTGQTLSMSLILGYLLSPLAWIIGVPWSEATIVGGLIGEKIVINEFVAYLHLGQIKDTLSEHSVLISTYALCGFANFSSIAIQLGGIGGLAPNRRSDIARLGLRAVLGGTLATMMTATIAGVLTQFAA